MEIEKILVVDDEMFVREFLSNILNDHGYITEMADGGKAALEICKDATDIRLIVSDMNMPEMSGLELIKELKETSSRIPIIILTGSDEISLAINAINNGASDYLLKDENIQETILHSVEKIVNAERMREENERLIHDFAINNYELGKANYELKETLDALKISQEELEKRNNFIQKTFGRFLSDEIVLNLLDDPDGLNIGGENKKVTIMMADLRGFTAISEHLDAESVVKVINNFLSPMIEILMKYNGTIDEFLGDAILAIFGAPLSREDDTERAVACAVEMQLAMKDINEKNVAEGLPEVNLGIGVNTGQVVVGNIGSEKRTKYGVVGRHVNLTARIEAYTVGGQIFISEYTYNDLSSEIRIDNQLQVEPKGVKTPITIYEVGGIKGKYNLFLPENNFEELLTLDKKLPISYKVLKGKHTSKEVYEGFIVEMGKNGFLLETDGKINIFDNIKVAIDDELGNKITQELYAKVVKHDNSASNIYLIRMTSVPDEARAFIKKLKG
ncbi:MAG: adenylate/guanylate cyclase domain-containing response regulator [Nitrospinae bacterium]|nr:adenylate/guanylate cyclase domain-containing response regulator [Nitrospinota bacterium]